MTNDLYPTHVADLLTKRAELTPDRVGLLDAETGVAYTYRQLNARANQAANYLGSLGIAKGCLLYTSPSPRDRTRSRMPSSA